MAKPLSVVQLLAAGGALVLSLSSCGDSCPFGLLARRQFVNTVPCCGAFVHQDFQAPDDVEIDVSNVQATGGGRVDAWVTRTDCDRLFDGTYPPPSGTQPRCTVILGPVLNGTTSSRQKVSSGSYRIHLQAYSTNTAAAQSGVEVGFWGSNCSGTVF